MTNSICRFLAGVGGVTAVATPFVKRLNRLTTFTSLFLLYLILSHLSKIADVSFQWVSELVLKQQFDQLHADVGHSRSTMPLFSQHCVPGVSESTTRHLSLRRLHWRLDEFATAQRHASRIEFTTSQVNCKRKCNSSVTHATKSSSKIAKARLPASHTRIRRSEKKRKKCTESNA
jgi:hypothetical protein